MKAHPPIPDFLVLETLIDFHNWQSGLGGSPAPPPPSCAPPLFKVNKSRTSGLWPHSVASGEPCAFPDSVSNKLFFFKLSSCLLLRVVNYKLALAVYLYEDQIVCCCSCQFSTPSERSSGWRSEMRHSVLNGSGTGRTGLQIVRYFQEPILWA